MDEIIRISKKYLYTTANLRHFGLKGTLLILIGMPFVLVGFWLSILQTPISQTMLPFILMLPGFFCWLSAKKEYNKSSYSNLVNILNNDFGTLEKQKSAYLKVLTKNIGNSNYDTLNNIIRLKKIREETRGFVPENMGFFLKRFIYNSDAKSRINSLFILLVSVIVLLLITKTDIKTDPGVVLSFLGSDTFLKIISWGSFSIILGFFLLYASCSFINLFFLKPIVFINANDNFAINYLINELSKYSFLD